jgi:hypothetical protein
MVVVDSELPIGNGDRVQAGTPAGGATYTNEASDCRFHAQDGRAGHDSRTKWTWIPHKWDMIRATYQPWRGRGGGTRTHDLVLPKHVRYHCATPRWAIIPAATLLIPIADVMVCCVP